MTYRKGTGRVKYQRTEEVALTRKQIVKARRRLLQGYTMSFKSSPTRTDLLLRWGENETEFWDWYFNNLW